MRNDQIVARVIATELKRNCPDRLFMFAGLKDEPDVNVDLDKKTPIVWFDIALRRLGEDKTARVIIKATENKIRFTIDDFGPGSFDERWGRSKRAFEGESVVDIINTAEAYLKNKYNWNAVVKGV
jgi:hypothetical protein